MTFEEAHTTQQVIRSFQQENPDFSLELIEHDKIKVKYKFLIMKLHVFRNVEHFKKDLSLAKKELAYQFNKFNE